MQEPTLLGVLSGKNSVKVEIALDFKTISILCVGLFLAILAALVISKNL
jgi:hypothetical protein